MKENIIPSDCEVVLDCRILPGQTSTIMLSQIKKALSDIGAEKLTYEILQIQEPSESQIDTPLYDVISNTLREYDLGCGVAPVLMTGGTESRFFRKTGSICYGFHPRHPEAMYGKIITREHDIDERISISDLIFGTSVLYETIRRFLLLQCFRSIFPVKRKVFKNVFSIIGDFSLQYCHSILKDLCSLD